MHLFVQTMRQTHQVALRQHLPETSFRIELCSKGCYWSHSRQLRLWPLQKLLELRPKELVRHPSLRGNTRLGAHSSVPWALRPSSLELCLRSRPTEKSVIPAPDQFREREVFTSNTVGTSSNLLCSTHCMLTRA